MSEREAPPVESGLEKVADAYSNLLPERNGSTLWVHPSKKTNDQSRSFFSLHERDGRCWVRCRGKGGTRPDCPGPAIDEITEQWVIAASTRFIEATRQDLGLNSEAAGS
jgi:hypothetical protein